MIIDNMSEVHVSESQNTSTNFAQRKKQRAAGARKSTNGVAAAAGMSIAANKQNSLRQTWPTSQPAANSEAEAEEQAGQQLEAGEEQAISGTAVSAPLLDSSESVSAALTDIISGILKQTEAAMEDLLPMINEIDSSAVDIKEELNQKRDMALERRSGLEQTRERFQQAASSVLDILSLSASMLGEAGETST